MKIHLVAITLISLSSSIVEAQIIVENPQHVYLPEQRAQMLHHIICRVVADELRIRASKTDLSITLVLGEPRERIGVGNDGTPDKIYLMHWNEASFAIGDMQLVSQRIIVRERLTQMTNEVFRRWKQTAPVPASELTPQNMSSDAGTGSQTNKARDDIQRFQFWRRWNESLNPPERR